MRFRVHFKQFQLWFSSWQPGITGKSLVHNGCDEAFSMLSGMKMELSSVSRETRDWAANDDSGICASCIRRKP